MKIKIVTYDNGDNAFYTLQDCETNNPEIFMEGRKISIDSDTVYVVKRSWFNVSKEILYVQVVEMGKIFNWLNGFI